VIFVHFKFSALGIFFSNYSWLILPKHSFISPSKIHAGESFLASKQNICSHVSFALLQMYGVAFRQYITRLLFALDCPNQCYWLFLPIFFAIHDFIIQSRGCVHKSRITHQYIFQLKVHLQMIETFNVISFEVHFFFFGQYLNFLCCLSGE
jgi:hypothetical protein